MERRARRKSAKQHHDELKYQLLKEKLRSIILQEQSGKQPLISAKDSEEVSLNSFIHQLDDSIDDDALKNKSEEDMCEIEENSDFAEKEEASSESQDSEEIAEDDFIDKLLHFQKKIENEREEEQRRMKDKFRAIDEVKRKKATKRKFTELLGISSDDENDVFGEDPLNILSDSTDNEDANDESNQGKEPEIASMLDEIFLKALTAPQPAFQSGFEVNPAPYHPPLGTKTSLFEMSKANSTVTSKPTRVISSLSEELSTTIPRNVQSDNRIQANRKDNRLHSSNYFPWESGFTKEKQQSKPEQRTQQAQQEAPEQQQKEHLSLFDENDADVIVDSDASFFSNLSNKKQNDITSSSLQAQPYNYFANATQHSLPVSLNSSTSLNSFSHSDFTFPIVHNESILFHNDDSVLHSFINQSQSLTSASNLQLPSKNIKENAINLIEESKQQSEKHTAFGANEVLSSKPDVQILSIDDKCFKEKLNMKNQSDSINSPIPVPLTESKGNHDADASLKSQFPMQEIESKSSIETKTITIEKKIASEEKEAVVSVQSDADGLHSVSETINSLIKDELKTDEKEEKQHTKELDDDLTIDLASTSHSPAENVSFKSNTCDISDISVEKQDSTQSKSPIITNEIMKKDVCITASSEPVILSTKAESIKVQDATETIPETSSNAQTEDISNSPISCSSSPHLLDSPLVLLDEHSPPSSHSPSEQQNEPIVITSNPQSPLSPSPPSSAPMSPATKRFLSEDVSASINDYLETESKRISKVEQTLQEKIGHASRDAAMLPENAIAECQHLLSLFGIPFVTSAGEAEACCVQLEREGVVDGIVSEDSDCFPFGAHLVIRGLLTGGEEDGIYAYSSRDIEDLLGLNQHDIIDLSQLMGCDYSEGIKGIGKMKALEVITGIKRYQEASRNSGEDPSKDLPPPLTIFTEWIKSNPNELHPLDDFMPQSIHTLRKSLSHSISPFFPSFDVEAAFLRPLALTDAVQDEIKRMKEKKERKMRLRGLSADRSNEETNNLFGDGNDEDAPESGMLSFSRILSNGMEDVEKIGLYAEVSMGIGSSRVISELMPIIKRREDAKKNKMYNQTTLDLFLAPPVFFEADEKPKKGRRSSKSSKQQDKSSKETNSPAKKKKKRKTSERSKKIVLDDSDDSEKDEEVVNVDVEKEISNEYAKDNETGIDNSPKEGKRPSRNSRPRRATRGRIKGRKRMIEESDFFESSSEIDEALDKDYVEEANNEKKLDDSDAFEENGNEEDDEESDESIEWSPKLQRRKKKPSKRKRKSSHSPVQDEKPVDKSKEEEGDQLKEVKANDTAEIDWDAEFEEAKSLEKEKVPLKEREKQRLQILFTKLREVT
ncbi:TFIIH basal transcription factor complex helicase XPG subunit [Monocercomonoides exilis]|uniref:TFIIH basal transcription factor complex helicase XPG subunit n=1 Tax=Monocercomonoides exilis TaxID=2049356 RepID=UPI00355ACA20|nr:TFIIH basal transcription factor complex helicase XPG subunit [Monocercomonoides exilis]|eukprot:MONOS_6667.1-p1 / transcript=MONOS_6667.1 / gene=MONOS_6667 / organism=Monocercomonoides_exilis_PA203 / gene_product=TFIIH basal transcription factor complex helicase XPG subunit / transcript_product=TFIIH basal transcription factor complex helicase XPG subunit / location=Mono_scaffold00214:40484-45214(-) / protein_length=1351 / sequence_SO=supercontig / SO=protein_coding / is_pseudo=false